VGGCGGGDVGGLVFACLLARFSVCAQLMIILWSSLSPAGGGETEHQVWARGSRTWTTCGATTQGDDPQGKPHALTWHVEHTLSLQTTCTTC